MDALGLYAFRGKWDGAILRLAIPAGLLGILVGALTFRWLNEGWIRGLIGVEAVVFALQKFREGSKAWEGPPQPVRAGPARFWSAVAGFTSFVSHAGGPPMMQFLMPLKLDRVLMVATMTWYFAAINFAKWVPYSMLGLIDLQHLTTSAALLPVVPFGYGLGLYFLKRVPQAGFIRFSTSFAQGLPTHADRNGYHVVRKGSRYSVFPRGVARELWSRHEYDALVEIWNGVPWLSPVWCHKPRITFLHHVHGPMWNQLLPRPLAFMGRAVEARLA